MLKIKELSLILACLVCLSSVAFAEAFAPVPVLRVSPPEISANPGDSFTIDINIEDVVDLFSYEAKLGFDSNLLTPVSVDEGPFIRDQTTSPMGTYFTYIVSSDYIYVACVTLGKYPGISGSGVLVSITFNVMDAGACDLPLYDTILLDSTGTMMSHDTAGGYFYITACANLVRRSAWPEHHHFVVSKDEDAIQSLFTKVKNIGPIDLYVKVTFDIMRGDTFVTTVSTDEIVVTPDTIMTLTANFGPLVPADAGKYYVSAKAWYSWSGTYWSQGEKVKTFSFAVVP